MQTVSTAESPIAPPRKLPWYRKLGMQVLVALILGIVVGFAFFEVRHATSPPKLGIAASRLGGTT